LSKWRAFPEHWSFPVDNVNCDDEDEGDAGQNGGRICKRLPSNV
jgi:hypothetical protein